MPITKQRNNMENQEIFNPLVTELLNKFPEFAQSPERNEVYENDGAYIYYSYFGDFLLNHIDADENSEFVLRAFSFINEVFERTELNSKIWDLFVIELFERFDMEDKYTQLANKLLNGKALLAFQERNGRPNN